MKKIVFACLVALGAFAVSQTSFATDKTNENELVVPTLNSVKIVNDTKTDYRIHTGSAHVMLYHGGGSTSVSCENGRKISYSNGSKATGLIFTIDQSMCGKTVKLSSYIK